MSFTDYASVRHGPLASKYGCMEDSYSKVLGFTSVAVILPLILWHFGNRSHVPLVCSAVHLESSLGGCRRSFGKMGTFPATPAFECCNEVDRGAG
jgi:hypothetical protein